MADDGTFAKLVIEDGSPRWCELYLKTDLYDQNLEETFLSGYTTRQEALEAATPLARLLGGLPVEVEPK